MISEALVLWSPALNGEKQELGTGPLASFPLFGRRLPSDFGGGVGELDFSSIWGNLVKSCNLFDFVSSCENQVTTLITSWTSLKTKFR